MLLQTLMHLILLRLNNRLEQTSRLQNGLNSNWSLLLNELSDTTEKLSELYHQALEKFQSMTEEEQQEVTRNAMYRLPAKFKKQNLQTGCQIKDH